MTTARDPTQTTSHDVAFELERVDWTSADRLEVEGRWFGVRGRRFIRPTLDVDVDGQPRRILAVLDHKPWAALDGERWVAAFDWQGEPVDLAGSELTVAPNVAVELRPPGSKGTAKRRRARPSRGEVLASDLANARAEAQRLARELEAAQSVYEGELERKRASHEAELERVRAVNAQGREEAERRESELRAQIDAERSRADRLESELRAAREELASAQAASDARRYDLDRERATIAAEIREAGAGEVERLRGDVEAAIQDTATANAQRDAARRESVSARAERDAAIRERDRAQTERDALLARARSEAKRRSAQISAAGPGSASASAPDQAGASRPAPASGSVSPPAASGGGVSPSAAGHPDARPLASDGGVVPPAAAAALSPAPPPARETETRVSVLRQGAFRQRGRPVVTAANIAAIVALSAVAAIIALLISGAV